jgi:hypothetical protein
MAARVYWVKPPSSLVDPLKQYRERALVAIYAAAGYIGQQMQDSARRKALWEDRTGNARSGLFFAVDGFGLSPIVGQTGSMDFGLKTKAASQNAIISGTTDRLVLALSHTMWYGQFLELSNGGRYAIIMSTMDAHLPQLQSLVQRVFK